MNENTQTIRFHFPKNMIGYLQEGPAYTRVIGIYSIIINGKEYKNLNFEKMAQDSDETRRVN